jgi:hypothetical protein
MSDTETHQTSFLTDASRNAFVQLGAFAMIGFQAASLLPSVQPSINELFTRTQCFIHQNQCSNNFEKSIQLRNEGSQHTANVASIVGRIVLLGGLAGTAYGRRRRKDGPVTPAA